MKTKFKGELSFDAFKKMNIKIKAGEMIVNPMDNTIKKERPKLKTNYKKFKQPKPEEVEHEQTT